MIRRPPKSTLFPYTTPLPICRQSPWRRDRVGRRIADSRLDESIPPLPALAALPAVQPVMRLHARQRSEEHTSELQSRQYLVCRLLLEKKKTKTKRRLVPTI